jgi:hypothetical protein
MVRLDIATMETATAIGMLVIILYTLTIKIKIERYFRTFNSPVIYFLKALLLLLLLS